MYGHLNFYNSLTRTVITEKYKKTFQTKTFQPLECEPKRKNRFIVNFPHIFEIPSFSIQEISRPKLFFDVDDYRWQNIEINLIDLIGPSTSNGLMNIISFCKELKTNNNKNEILFSFIINDLDPTGVTVGTWIIDVKELILVDFGNYDYNSEDLQTCKLVLEPLNCRIQ